MKTAAILVFTFFPTVTFSQGTAVQTVTGGINQSDQVTKVIRVRYGNPKSIAGLATNGVPVNVNADNVLKVIVLHGRADDVAAVEQIIRELDVPATAQASRNKDIELVVSVVGGSDKAELLPGGPISELIAPVIKQLRAVFPYKNYQLLSSMLLRSSEGAKAGNNGVMKSLTNFGNYSYPSGYAVGYDEVSVSSEEGKPNVHLRNFIFKTTVPTPAGGPDARQFQLTDIVIRTDIDLREGQKVVAGKANIDNSDLALFVVLTARVAE
jgi:hypothetical protein